MAQAARSDDLGKFNLLIHRSNIKKIKTWVDTKLPSTYRIFAGEVEPIKKLREEMYPQ